ncbi:MAG: hypothetical protein Q9M27_05780 [Mariprofundaceae bacterium]|nr:hypothetical protein [Mariprofundaceae bacterium]
MNTPSHLVINMLLLDGIAGKESESSVALGSVLPDIPIWIFFLYARLIRRLPQHKIWREAYYEPEWQGLFDAAHSFPLVLVGMATMAWFDMSWWFWLFASMGLHALFDLLLHHDDAHRHFFPLSNWHFASPVSYWDARYHGVIAARVEVLAVLFACIVLWQLTLLPAMRWLVGAIASLYALYAGIALIARLRWRKQA